MKHWRPLHGRLQRNNLLPHIRSLSAQVHAVDHLLILQKGLLLKECELLVLPKMVNPMTRKLSNDMVHASSNAQAGSSTAYCMMFMDVHGYSLHDVFQSLTSSRDLSECQSRVNDRIDTAILRDFHQCIAVPASGAKHKIDASLGSSGNYGQKQEMALIRDDQSTVSGSAAT